MRLDLKQGESASSTQFDNYNGKMQLNSRSTPSTEPNVSDACNSLITTLACEDCSFFEQVAQSFSPEVSRSEAALHLWINHDVHPEKEWNKMTRNGTTWKHQKSLEATGCQGVILYQHRRSPLPRMQEVEDNIGSGIQPMAVDGSWWGARRPRWRIGRIGGWAAKFQPCHRGVRGGAMAQLVMKEWWI